MLWFQICFAKTHFLFQNTSTWTCLKGFFLLIHTSSCRHHESNEQSENIIIFHNNCLDHARKFCYQIELTLLSRRLGNVWKYTSLRYLSYSITSWQGHMIVIPISHFLWMKERNSESRKCSGHAQLCPSSMKSASSARVWLGIPSNVCQVSVFRKLGNLRQDEGRNILLSTFDYW